MLNLNPSDDVSTSSHTILGLLLEALRKSPRVINDQFALLNSITTTVVSLLKIGVLFHSRE